MEPPPNASASAPPGHAAGKKNPLKDCFNPACSSKIHLFSKSLHKSKEAPPQCPLDREELGRSTWDLLHTTAAYYPETPSDADKSAASMLVKGLAALYPCEHCAEDFREATAAEPPSLGSRSTFMLWMCRQHNIVNDKLGKPLFKCDEKTLDRRWKLGPKECGFEAPESLGKDLERAP